MTEQAPEPITTEQIAAAPFVLVVAPDGRASLQVAVNVDDAALGAYLHDVAEHVRTGAHRGGCAECSAGRPHQHAQPEADDG